ARPNMGFTLEEWIASAPRLGTDWRSLERTYGRSLIDLAGLRFYPPILPGMALPAAGMPWFMTVFGRDSVLTGYQRLPFTPELAETTLRALAAQQGKGIDPFRRGAREDLPRDPLRRADRVRGAAALALLRLGRLDAAVSDPARRERTVDRERRSRPRA